MKSDNSAVPTAAIQTAGTASNKSLVQLGASLDTILGMAGMIMLAAAAIGPMGYIFTIVPHKPITEVFKIFKTLPAYLALNSNLNPA